MTNNADSLDVSIDDVTQRLQQPSDPDIRADVPDRAIGWHVIEDGVSAYWNGNKWTHHVKESQNPALKTIGWIAVILLLLGAVTLVVAITSQSDAWTIVGIYLASGGASIGFTWLCLKVIVTEIRKLRP